MSSTINILIADDSEVIQLAISEMLNNDNNHSYNIITACNGREACTLAYKEKPDIIIIDIEMPIMNGIDAIHKIKSEKTLKDIPIIVLSSTRSFEKAFNAGANDFLMKPVDQYELILRVQLNLDLALTALKNQEQKQILEQQQKQVIEQRDSLIAYQKDLLDDMQYARTIQNAVCYDEQLLKKLGKAYFIYNNPKNIVSGDFFWIKEKEEFFFFALGDCTGHGIAGALMTIAGNAFLEDIATNNSLINSNDFLNELRNRIIKLLHQKGDIGEARNGMDISFCVFNTETLELEYSGANSPVYIKQKNKPEIEIFKPDRMPIGFDVDYRKPFKKQSIKLKKGDRIYMFSDGYADQFGGELNKKFKYSPFRELLASTSELSMKNQLKSIESTMKAWKGQNEQVDDMLIIGFEI